MSESFVWKYFVKGSTQDFAICKECKIEIECKGWSTSGLIRHLKNKHNIEKSEVAQTKRKAEDNVATSSKRQNSQRTLTSFFTTK